MTLFITPPFLVKVPVLVLLPCVFTESRRRGKAVVIMESISNLSCAENDEANEDLEVQPACKKQCVDGIKSP